MEWDLELPIVADVRVPPGFAAFIDYELREVKVVINGHEMQVPMKVPVLRGLIKLGEETK
jgi:hypothetical protein